MRIETSGFLLTTFTTLFNPQRLCLNNHSKIDLHLVTSIVTFLIMLAVFWQFL